MTNRPRVRPGSRHLSLLAGALLAGMLFVLFAALPAGSAPTQTQAAPTNTSLPTISGSAVQGQTLTASPGSWSGDTPITFTYQWLRCDSGGSGCAALSGETGVDRLVDSGDVGSTLRVRVTATNSSGQTSADSAATAVVTSSGSGGSGPPVNSSVPTISGSAAQGQTLTASPGTWTGATPITFAYQWQRCDSSGNNCNAISGETGTTRIVDSGDVGSRLRVKVTATNSAGTSSATSATTSIVTSSGGGGTGAPQSTSPPVISGTAAQGQTLTATTGTWTGTTPITFADQWYRCDSGGANCVAIAGEKGSTRIVDSGDVGFRLKVRVTATNSVGTASADSAVTDVVTSPASTLPPGAVTLPNGKISIPVTSVSSDQRLVVDGVQFTPNPVRSHGSPIAVRVHISDTRGYVVRDALVFVRSVPILTSTPPETATGQDGWVTFQVSPRADFPLRTGYSVQFFIRARRSGDNLLAGVSARRLVQVRTASG
jgi:hypothetical protein